VVTIFSSPSGESNGPIGIVLALLCLDPSVEDGVPSAWRGLMRTVGVATWLLGVSGYLHLWVVFLVNDWRGRDVSSSKSLNAYFRGLYFVVQGWGLDAGVCCFGDRLESPLAAFTAYFAR
jgi:hypothetical protein